MPSVLKIRTWGITFLTVWFMPCALARTERIQSRGAKHGERKWQYDHWKARDATKGARKKGKHFIVQRCQEDETCRASQTFPGSCTEEHCRDLDYLAPIDISYVATWKNRSRYKNKSCAETQSWTTSRADDKCRWFSTSSWRTWSSPTSTRTGESLHPEKRTRATASIRWKIAIRFWAAKLELESQLVAGIMFIFSLVAVKKWHEPQQGEWQDQQWWEER